ncbi:hypothetical protein [Paenibacillus sp. YIM B09110]|uniref:hypothetical protein n=1 Tax=Paenibacillus sp. YIM B09110 TaxID=3126102 RepID=UPI00301BEABE
MHKARTTAILPTESEALNESVMPQNAPAAPSADNEVVMSSRFGGFDGIMSLMGNAQKFFSIFQQMQPMIKMAGSFFGPKAFLSSLPNEKVKTKNKKSAKGSRAASHSRKKTK